MSMVRVRVPATSANLGPGFDCLGLALCLYNELEVQPAERFEIRLEGEGSAFIPTDRTNLTYACMEKVYEAVGQPMPALRMVQRNGIPLSRGLGSSAAAIVGGLVGANALLGGPLPKEELARMATGIEGHPDNVVPCLYGGMTACAMEAGEPRFTHGRPAERFRFAALVPDFFLPTKRAREVLPQEVPHADAVFNIGRAVLLWSALTGGQPELLRTACEDRLHQPYRSRLIPGWDEVIAQAHACGALACFLSGAGPTILCVYDVANAGFADCMQENLLGMEHAWQALPLAASPCGAEVW